MKIPSAQATIPMINKIGDLYARKLNAFENKWLKIAGWVWIRYTPKETEDTVVIILEYLSDVFRLMKNIRRDIDAITFIGEM